MRLSPIRIQVEEFLSYGLYTHIVNDDPLFWFYGETHPDKMDLQEQVDCYNAALQVLTPRDWFYGFYWWQWDTNPDSGGDAHTGFTVQNKPAEELLADWYINKLVGGRFTPAGVRGFEGYR